MKRNDWQKRFGAARRATDKALCEAAERAIALEEAKTAPEPQKPPTPPPKNAWSQPVNIGALFR